MAVVVLDGPMGTELAARGVQTRLPAWSAAALWEAPGVIADIHAAYAAAGATVHTANTFRTTRRVLGAGFQRWAELAVELARTAVAPSHWVAGSMAPLEDCYRPDLSPPDARPEHREVARVLADAGVDVLLCETFPHGGEALVAVEEAVRTGLPTWLALTAGPTGDLLTPAELRRIAVAAIERGVDAVLVNCVPVIATQTFVTALAAAVREREWHRKVRVGAYANAGAIDAEVGWSSPPPATGVQLYLEQATAWVDAGAGIIGSCCGTGPAHVAALADGLQPSEKC